LYFKELINKILTENTGRSQQQIDRDTQREFIMSAEEARNYGLIDQIVTKVSTST
jgi:ATP-dependent Clp protease protease subunit